MIVCLRVPLFDDSNLKKITHEKFQFLLFLCCNLLILMAFLIPIIRRRRRQYRVRRRISSAELTDAELKLNTRLTRYQYNYLLERVGPLIASESNSELTISADTKLLAVLEFLATGLFQWAVCQSWGFSQGMMSKFIGQVVEAINSLQPEFVHLPNEEELIQLADGFRRHNRLPDIIGCIDGTLIRVQSPHEDEAAFVDRKGNHSINVTLICDINMRIWYVNAQWPGSVHDQAVFDMSVLKQRFDENYFGTYKLIGDRGYRLQPYLLTVYRAPATILQIRFNAMITETRTVIERCIGLLKGRWRCLHATGGEFVYTPGKVCRFTLAACILHNLCLLSEDGIVAHDPAAAGLIVGEDPPNHAEGDDPAADVLNGRDEYVQAHSGVILTWRRYVLLQRRNRNRRRQNRRQRRM